MENFMLTKNAHWMFIFHLEYFSSRIIFWNIDEKKLFYLKFISTKKFKIRNLHKKILIKIPTYFHKNRFFLSLTYIYG
jgi:hypothetical protein